MAIFFGRPPLMSKRYSDRIQPLHLNDDVLMSSDTALVEATLSRLDSGGWDTEGNIWPVSWIKLRGYIAEFKEDFLEQSLAGKRPEDIAQKIQ